MATKNTLFRQTIKKKGHFRYADLYSFCVDWFRHENYTLIENNYTEKESGGAREVIIEWVPYKKVTDYFKFVIKVEWYINGLRPAEIERDGVKEKTNEGNLSIKVQGILYKDYEERWEVKPIKKFVRGVYEKYVIRTTVEQFEDRIAEECMAFVNEVKAFLDLQ